MGPQASQAIACISRGSCTGCLSSVRLWGLREATVFHLPGIGHSSSLLQGQAPSRDGIRGSPRWPAGPCCLLIQALIFSLPAQQQFQLPDQAQDPARTLSQTLASGRAELRASSPESQSSTSLPFGGRGRSTQPTHLSGILQE